MWRYGGSERGESKHISYKLTVEMDARREKPEFFEAYFAERGIRVIARQGIIRGMRSKDIYFLTLPLSMTSVDVVNALSAQLGVLAVRMERQKR